MRGAELLEHLASRVPGFEAGGDPVPLEGGLLNRIWRVPGRPAPVVAKQAPPFIASNPEVPLDAQRILFEARALADFAPGGRLAALADDLVRPPRPLHFDREHSLLVMEDLGDRYDLVRALQSGSDVSACGASLGRFIGRLHETTFRGEAFAADYRNEAIQSTRLEVQYRPVATWLEAEGVDPGRAAKLGTRARRLGESLVDPGDCLVMGDLWPPSILVDGERLRVIDWEFAHFGRPIQDLAHLGAHLFMRGCHAGRGSRLEGSLSSFWRAFTCAYRHHAGERRDSFDGAPARRDLATHFAAEVLARTLGPFASTYVFAGDGNTESRQRAVTAALRLLDDERAFPAIEDLLDQ